MKKMLIVLCFIFSKIFADGVIIPPPDEEIYGYTQVAIIKFENKKENLIILNKHYSYTGNLAWIIPFPSKPHVDTFNIEVFFELIELTKPVQERYYNDLGCISELTQPEEGDTKEFKIIETGNFPGIEYTVIYAEKEDTLCSWLSTNGFQIDNKVSSIIKYYIQKNWKYFFTAKASSERSYELLGIKIDFETEKPVYPMKLTSVNFNKVYELYLYTLLANIKHI